MPIITSWTQISLFKDNGDNGKGRLQGPHFTLMRNYQKSSNVNSFVVFFGVVIIVRTRHVGLGITAGIKKKISHILRPVLAIPFKRFIDGNTIMYFVPCNYMLLSALIPILNTV